MLLVLVVLQFSRSYAQVGDLKEIRSKKFKLQNEIKNLIRKRSESQRNILYLEYEIEETRERIKENQSKILQIEENIKKNLKTFVVSHLREMNSDLSFRSRVEAQIYYNWKKQSDQIQRFKEEMQIALDDMNASKKELQQFVDTSKSLTFRIEKDIDELNEQQVALRYRAVSDGPDSIFYAMAGRLLWPVAKAKLVGSRGFYKVHGEKVFNYNEGMKFVVTPGSAVFPIYRGQVEEVLDIAGLGPLIVIKHTENIRSFYIGALSNRGISKGSNVSPDQQIGLVKDGNLELKLRFDTESLDPVQWVTRRR